LNLSQPRLLHKPRKYLLKMIADTMRPVSPFLLEEGTRAVLSRIKSSDRMLKANSYEILSSL
jgi:hypothetical protein